MEVLADLGCYNEVVDWKLIEDLLCKLGDVEDFVDCFS